MLLTASMVACMRGISDSGSRDPRNKENGLLLPKASASGPVLRFPLWVDTSEDATYVSRYTGEQADSQAPVRILRATIILGKATFPIAVLDANRDGHFGGRTDDRFREPDLILIDFDGDSHFEARRGQDATTLDHESFFLSGPIQMPDGLFYELSIDEKRLILSMQEMTHVSVIKLAQRNALFESVLHGGRIESRTCNGLLVLPADTYANARTILLERASHRDWHVSLNIADLVRLRSHETTILKVGGHYRLSLLALDSAGTAVPRGRPLIGSGRIRLVVTDESGNAVDDVRSPDGMQPTAPTLRIYDRRRRLIGVKQFHYG